MVTQWVSRRPERGRYPTHRGASAPSIRTGIYAPADARAPSARTEPLRSQRIGSGPSTRTGQPPESGPRGAHQPGGLRPLPSPAHPHSEFSARTVTFPRAGTPSWIRGGAPTRAHPPAPPPAQLHGRAPSSRMLVRQARSVTPPRCSLSTPTLSASSRAFAAQRRYQQQRCPHQRRHQCRSQRRLPRLRRCQPPW